MLRASSFTFASYKVDAARSIISCTYRVTFGLGITKTLTDRLYFPDVPSTAWEKVPSSVLEATLQALLLMIGINYWSAFPTKNIKIEGFTLTREQARFWDAVYLHGLAEFFYEMKIDFRGLVAFPHDDTATEPSPTEISLPVRTLLLNGAGKDSILSAELLKESATPFDLFTFSPTPAHERIAALIGAKSIAVERKRDSWLREYVSLCGISQEYPSVSMFTFVGVLLAQLLGYDSILFSNERSADFGNLTYLGMQVNHQWCKSSEAERLIQNYIHSYITPSVSTRSILRGYSELEIVERFVEYQKYLHHFTSCNRYFWLPRAAQALLHQSYWCKRCPKCVFLFACFSAFLPKEQVVAIFGADLYVHERLLPIFKQILGIEGFKPFDCVGEPDEMVRAMQLAYVRNEYAGEPAMRLFEERFHPGSGLDVASRGILTS